MCIVLFRNPHLMEQPDRGDPAIDFVGFRRRRFRGLLRQRFQAAFWSLPGAPPATVKAGAIPKGYKGRFGWHNLRHSLATFFAANDLNLPVIQSILRHSKPSTTALCTHRVNAAQVAAQAKFLDAIKVTSAVA